MKKMTELMTGIVWLGFTGVSIGYEIPPDPQKAHVQNEQQTYPMLPGYPTPPPNYAPLLCLERFPSSGHFKKAGLRYWSATR